MKKRDELEQAMASRQTIINKMIGRNKEDKKQIAVIDKKKEPKVFEIDNTKFSIEHTGRLLITPGPHCDNLWTVDSPRDVAEGILGLLDNAKQAKVGKKPEQGKSEEKPELRHGDYGPDSAGDMTIMFRRHESDGGGFVRASLSAKGSLQVIGGGRKPRYLVKTVLGNLIDDLTETSEGFEMENGRYSDVSVDHYDDHIHIRQDSINSIIVHNDNLPEFHRKLGHVLNGLRSNHDK